MAYKVNTSSLYILLKFEWLHNQVYGSHEVGVFEEAFCLLSFVSANFYSLPELLFKKEILDVLRQ